MSRGNQLLDRLIAIAPAIGDVAGLDRCESGQVFEQFDALVFPANSVVSLMIGSPGRSAELTLVGRDGFVGPPVVTTRLPPGFFAEVSIPGSGWTVPITVATEAMADSPQVAELLTASAASTALQVARQAYCNLYHSVDQRVCRWLITASERLGDDSFNVTQGFLSARLAVRRASVNVVQRRLQSDGVIDYGSGRLRIIDRHRLADHACECHRIVDEQIATVLR